MTLLTPLPPVLPADAVGRRAPADMVQAVGPFLANFIHHYHLAGPVYRYGEGPGQTVVMGGVEANLFVSKQSRQERPMFAAGDFRQKQLEELGTEKYLAGMDGEAHYHHRKLQTRGYSRSVLEQRYPELVAITQRHSGQWQPDQPLAFYRLMQAMIVEQLGSLILNHASPEQWQHICYYVSTMLTASFAGRSFDEQQRAAYGRLKQEMMGLMDGVIAGHRATAEGPHRPDLVDDVLAGAADGRPLSEQALRIAALTVYIAGIEPVAHTCTFMLYALLRQPERLGQIVAELDRVLDGQPLSPSSLRQLDNLRYATLETLRFYPFAPILQMTAQEDFEFQGYRITAGSPLIIAQAVTHFLPEVYPDPYQFDPDRFRPERAEQRQPGTFVPYGIGPHICLGAGFAETQIMVTMATLLHSLELAEDPTTADPIPGSRNRDAFKIRLIRRRR